MRKTRLVIQPVRCLHAVGFLLLYMSCPVLGDWGLIQPEPTGAQRTDSLQRENAKIVIKDPPESRVVEPPESAWARQTDAAERYTSLNERRWLEIRNQRLSPEKSSGLFRERQSSMSRRVENREQDNNRRLSKQQNGNGYRLHTEERLASPTRRLVRNDMQSEARRDSKIRYAARQERHNLQSRSNQRLLMKGERMSVTNDIDKISIIQFRDENRANERADLKRSANQYNVRERTERQYKSSMPKEHRRSTLDFPERNMNRRDNSERRDREIRSNNAKRVSEQDERSTNVRERSIERNQRRYTTTMRSEVRRSLQENDQERVMRQTNAGRQEHEVRINIAEEQLIDGRSVRSIVGRREENRAIERSDRATRTNSLLRRSVEQSTNRRDRSMERGERQYTSTRRNEVNRSFQDNEVIDRVNTGRVFSNIRIVRNSMERRQDQRDSERLFANRSLRRSVTKSTNVRVRSIDESQYGSDRTEDRRSFQNNPSRAVLRQNDERREYSQRKEVTIAAREARIDRNDRQYVAARTQDRRYSHENEKDRVDKRQNVEHHELSRRELIRRDASNGESRRNQGEFSRTQERRESERRTDRQQEVGRTTIRHKRQDSITKDRRAEDSDNRENRGRLEKSARTDRYNVREVRDQADRYMARRNERFTIREERRVVEKLETRPSTPALVRNQRRNVELKIKGSRSVPLVQNRQLATVFEKESVMRNSLNEIKFSSQKENNNKRETSKAVELNLDNERNEREMFTKKPYTQESVQRMFDDNNDNWISYKKIAGNCLLGAIAYFVTTRNPKIAY